MNKQTGVTLVELLVTITIMGILLGIAVPNMRDFMLANKVSASVAELTASLAYARSEAIKRATRVSLCKSNDESTCTTAGTWEQGWIVFTDGGTAGTKDGTDAVIRVGAVSSGVTVTAAASDDDLDVLDWMSYMPSGVSEDDDNTDAEENTFTICNGAAGVDVEITVTGRANTAAGETC